MICRIFPIKQLPLYNGWFYTHNKRINTNYLNLEININKWDAHGKEQDRTPPVNRVT